VVIRRLAANPPALPWARPRLQLVLGLALAGGLATAVDQFVFGAGVTLGVLIRIAAEAVALVLCMTIGRGAVPVGFVAVLVIALSGHAPRVDPPVPAIIDEAIHVVSAGMWAGGIVVLAALHPPGGWRGEEGRELIERFGRVAILALAITALTGVLRATQELTAVSDLWATGYGLVLAAKSAGVLAMAGSQLVGIFTERDTVRSLSHSYDAPAHSVSSWMTPEPMTVTPESSTDEALKTMLDHNFRHLPVMEGGEVVGIVSIRDLAAL